MSQAVVVEGKRVAKWKVEEVNELTDLLKGNKTVLIASVESFPADKLHEIRKRLRGKAVVRVTKNTLFRIAAKKSGIDVEKIDQYLTGPNAFIFTNDNPFEIYMFFETPLDYVLRVKGIRNLVIVGTVANICVLHTAGSAALRWYNVVVPEDGISALTEFDQIAALRQIDFLYKGKITTSDGVVLTV